MTGEGEVVLGHHVPILSAWNALRIKEIKVLQVLLSLPCSYYLCVSGSRYSLGHVELPGWLCSNFVPHIHHCHPGWGENIFFYWLRMLHTLLILYGCGGWREWSEWGNVWGSVVGWRGPSTFSAVGSGRWLMETQWSASPSHHYHCNHSDITSSLRSDSCFLAQGMRNKPAPQTTYSVCLNPSERRRKKLKQGHVTQERGDKSDVAMYLHLKVLSIDMFSSRCFILYITVYSHL